MTQPPKLAVGDGAMGFWAAMSEAYPETDQQRCWVHNTANVLDKLPKGGQPQAKSMLHEIWQADTRQAAEKAFERFLKTFGDEYPKATGNLASDRERLLAF